MVIEVNWSNITDLGQIPAAANTVTGGSFWVGMLYMIWIILILLMLAYGFEIAILASSFVALIIGLILVYADLVAFKWVITFIGVIIFMFFYIMWNRPTTKT